MPREASGLKPWGVAPGLPCQGWEKGCSPSSECNYMQRWGSLGLGDG